MIVAGGFGGFLNFLHNFDTTEGDKKDGIVKYKYILLGIGAAFLVPVFLKTISSGIIACKENTDYLIFAGFCLIAAIFSKRFIATIGDKILEKVEKVEKISQENKLKIETNQAKISEVGDRVEVAKLATDIRNTEGVKAEDPVEKKQELIELANSYVSKTSIQDHARRVSLKAEIGRRMGEIIVRNNLDRQELCKENPIEGMCVALAYSVQLQPTNDGVEILNRLSKTATQRYTKFSILIGYEALARNGFISKSQAKEIYNLIKEFKTDADRSLWLKIDEAVGVLQLIDPTLK
jgi:hypothetical protein